MFKNIMKWMARMLFIVILALSCLALVGWTANHGWEWPEFMQHVVTEIGYGTTQTLPKGAVQTFQVPMGHSAIRTNCVAITGATANKTLATTSNFFRVCAADNTAFISCDGSAATTTVGTGYDFRVEPSQCIEKTITEAACAVIGSVAGGVVCFDPKVAL